MNGKIFASTYTGSMCGQRDLLTLWPWVIANTKDDHTIEINPMLVAAVLGEKPEVVEETVQKLCSPDPRSRTKERDGRRLIPKGEFLYHVVTHEKYNSVANTDERKEYNRLKQQEHRERNRKREPKAKALVTKKDEAIAHAAEKEIETGFAGYVYDGWVARGGKDGSGIAVEWMPYVEARWAREGKDWTEGNHIGKQGGVKSNGTSTSRYGGVPTHVAIKAVEEQIAKHPANPSSTFSNPNCTEEEKAELKALRQQREALSRKIVAEVAQQQTNQ